MVQPATVHLVEQASFCEGAVFVSRDQASSEVDVAFGLCLAAAVNGQVSEVHGLAEGAYLSIPPLGVGLEVRTGERISASTVGAGRPFRVGPQHDLVFRPLWHGQGLLAEGFT